MPGFSSCAHAYLLSSSGIDRLCTLDIDTVALPVDDLIPSLYACHPRPDVSAWAALAIGFRGPLRALAFRTELVYQLESVAAMVLDEPLIGGCTLAGLSRSDIRPVPHGKRRYAPPHARGLVSAPAIFQDDEVPLPSLVPMCRPTHSACRHSSMHTRAASWCDAPAWVWRYAAAVAGTHAIGMLRCVSKGMRLMMDEMQVTFAPPLALSLISNPTASLMLPPLPSSKLVTALFPGAAHSIHHVMASSPFAAHAQRWRDFLISWCHSLALTSAERVCSTEVWLNAPVVDTSRDLAGLHFDHMSS